jgi:digeranylgeranylglycerophospholipid reductase
MKEVDLVITGASFAGLACGKAAAERGLKTVILEKKPEPGAYPHTTGILVKEIADQWNFPRRYTRKIRGVRLYSPSLKYIDLESPGYSFFATDTPNLMRWFAGQAQAAGAAIKFHSPFQRARCENDYLSLAQHDLKCRYLVGCDGALSHTAKTLSLGRNKDFLFGVEAEFTGITGLDENYLHVFLDAQLAPGYIAWIVPGVDVTQIGLAVRRPHMPKLDNMITKMKSLFDFTHSEMVGQRAGLIPCGGLVHPFARNNVLLLGDAAGMVSPLTGGGIHPALEIGHIAGVAISDYLLDEGYDPISEIKKIAPRYTFKKSLRMLVDALPITNTHYNLLFENKLFRIAAKSIFFHHRGLFSLKAWRDIAHDLILVRKT